MNLNELFPISLSERPLRFASTHVSAFRIVHEEMTKLARGQQAELESLLVTIAHTCFQLDQLQRDCQSTDSHAGPMIDALSIIADNLRDLLQRHQVEVRDLTGQVWTPELRKDVDLRGNNIREDLSEPRVAHMELPVVLRAGRCLAKGAAIIDTPVREG